MHLSFTFVQIIFTADQPQQPPSQLNIEISEEVAEGNYANLAIITNLHSEFVIDFGNVMPGTPKSKVNLASSIHHNMKASTTNP